MCAMLYHEVQKSRVLIITLSIGLVLEILAFLYVYARLPPEAGRYPVLAIIAASAVTMGLLLKWMKSLSIDLGPSELRVAFGPLGVTIPVKEITAVRIVKHGFVKSGGIGIRWVGWKRWHYIAVLGDGVEIQWGDKVRGFTTANPDRLKEIFSQLLPGRVEDQRLTG